MKRKLEHLVYAIELLQKGFLALSGLIGGQLFPESYKWKGKWKEHVIRHHDIRVSQDNV